MPRAPRNRILGLERRAFDRPMGDGLLRRVRSVLAFADVLHLLAHGLAGLYGRRVAFELVFLRSFQRRFVSLQVLVVL